MTRRMSKNPPFTKRPRNCDVEPIERIENILHKAVHDFLRTRRFVEQISTIDREDLVQNAWLHLLQCNMLDQATTMSADDLQARIRTIVLSRSQDSQRYHERDCRHANSLDSQSVEDQVLVDGAAGHAVEDLEIRDWLNKVCAKLAPEDQQLVDLYVHGRLSFQEAANKIGVTENAAQKRWRRISRHLQRAWSRHSNG